MPPLMVRNRKRSEPVATPLWNLIRRENWAEIQGTIESLGLEIDWMKRELEVDCIAYVISKHTIFWRKSLLSLGHLYITVLDIAGP